MDIVVCLLDLGIYKKPSFVEFLNTKIYIGKGIMWIYYNTASSSSEISA